MSQHPETSCDECGGPNISWFAPSPIWNRVALDANIICPLCFVRRAKAAGMDETWRLAPEFYEEKT